MKLFIALFFASVVTAAAQSPEVPHKMQFADLTLTIRDDARKEIQKDVDAYTSYPTSFNVKAERARTYFPVIEKIFREENVPEDFKFLVIQESALIPDAVSVSNAVGFWQFKDFTAIEMGLRVDKEIDERMNIVSATRAAARYLKKNNSFFDNWLFALQAYQMGAGGVMRSEKETKNGVKNIEITSNTYWYVKKFLAHKIAYEPSINGNAQVKFLPYTTSGKKTLTDISSEMAVEEQLMKDYNKWVRGSSIPDDRNYIVMVPVKGDLPNDRLNAFEKAPAVADASKGLHETAGKKGHIKRSEGYTKINGVLAVRAIENENPTKLSARAGVDLSMFLKWNDMSIDERTASGKYFLLGKKRARASSSYHKVLAGEDLWMISQQYAVQIKKLKKYNRMRGETLQPGTTLYLSGMKPKEGSGSNKNDAIVEVDNETFAWDVAPVAATVPIVVEKQTAEPEVVATTGESKDISNAEPVPADLEQNKNQTELIVLTTEPTDSVNTLPGQAKDEVKKEAVIIESQLNETSETKTEHVVQSKETLYGIAKQYNIAVMDLVKWNNLTISDGIKPGQIIKLTDPQQLAKASEPVQQEEIEHEVIASDTVYSIARKYGVTIKELMEWNNKKDFTLSVGEKLKIHKK